ncbi:MAG: 4-carboxy-4-hydroxy-2-oxoadipate aldolase/oxaloacetate decarboxylase [Deltaproteobacteria bacterium]|nr:4-carboxy-4-hydroxy-2-oxoadipate aldolase/oxaloacetate decarboxylase [Deltaproteobacteria bacterium]
MSDFNHVIHSIKRVPKDLVEAMRALPTATISEAYGSKGALFHHIKPIRTDMKLCGSVIPVKARPGDNLLAHKAIYVARPGDVLLIDTCSFVEGGFWGGIMTEAARKQGIEGLVTDGAVRDTEEIAAMGFPIFCQAISIKGTTKTSLGTINHPIHFGGIAIHPGDLIVGDADGIVVIARSDVSEVLEKAKEREEKERKICKQISAGKTTLEIYGFTEILKREGMKEEEVLK